MIPLNFYKEIMYIFPVGIFCLALFFKYKLEDNLGFRVFLGFSIVLILFINFCIKNKIITDF